ncbi:MAG: hypothetical protein HQK87_10560, partial [Nitrospinae bacterium]|nr:hypothetical protein [Nitrospinota bacterium]
MTSSALRRGLLKGGAVVALFALLFATGWLDLSALFIAFILLSVTKGSYPA